MKVETIKCDRCGDYLTEEEKRAKRTLSVIDDIQHPGDRVLDLCLSCYDMLCAWRHL